MSGPNDDEKAEALMKSIIKAAFAWDAQGDVDDEALDAALGFILADASKIGGRTVAKYRFIARYLIRCHAF